MSEAKLNVNAFAFECKRNWYTDRKTSGRNWYTDPKRNFALGAISPYNNKKKNSSKIRI